MEEISLVTRDERGTACAETALLVPLVALCWAGILFFFCGYDGSLAAGAQARLEALQRSAAGCRSQLTPGAQVEATALSASWADLVKQVPLLERSAGPVFSAAVTASAERTLPASPLLGIEARTVGSRFRVACNERPDTHQSVPLLDVACKYLGPLGLGSRCGGRS